MRVNVRWYLLSHYSNHSVLPWWGLVFVICMHSLFPALQTWPSFHTAAISEWLFSAVWAALRCGQPSCVRASKFPPAETVHSSSHLLHHRRQNKHQMMKAAQFKGCTLRSQRGFLKMLQPAYITAHTFYFMVCTSDTRAFSWTLFLMFCSLLLSFALSVSCPLCHFQLPVEVGLRSFLTLQLQSAYNILFVLCSVEQCHFCNLSVHQKVQRSVSQKFAH